MTPSRPVRTEASAVAWAVDKVAGLGASQLVFAVEVRRGHFEVTQGHARIGMSEQFHEGRKAHTSLSEA